MVKHIVLFQLKKDLDNSTKQRVMEQFKAGIEALPEKIDCIREIFVGFNQNEHEAWDICLNSTFDNLADVRSYSANPLHQAVAGALKPYVNSRSCVDYEQ